MCFTKMCAIEMQFCLRSHFLAMVSFVLVTTVEFVKWEFECCYELFPTSSIGSFCKFVRKNVLSVDASKYFSCLTLKIPDGPDPGPTDPIRVQVSCADFGKMWKLPEPPHEYSYMLLTSQGFQNNSQTWRTQGIWWATAI